MAEPLLASCSSDIRIWKLRDGAHNAQGDSVPQQCFNPHPGSQINTICWNHNNQVLISGSTDGTIAMSHISGSVLGALAPPEGQPRNEITCVCLSSGSRYLCSGGTGAKAQVWDLKEKEMIKEFTTHTDTITCIQFNHSDVHVVSGSLSGDVLIHSLLSTQVVATLSSPTQQPIRALQYSPHRKHQLATIGDKGTLVLWDSTEINVIAQFEGHTAPASGVNFSPINKLLMASAGLDRKLLFYDCNDRKVIKSIDAEAPLTGLSFLDDGVTVAAGTSSGLVLVYDLRRGSTPLLRVQAHPGQPVSAVQFQRSKASKSRAPRTPAAASPAPVAAAPVAAAPEASPPGAELSSQDLTPAVAPAVSAVPTPATAPPAAAPPVRRNLDDELKASQAVPAQATPAIAPPDTPPTTTPNPLYGDSSALKNSAAHSAAPSPAGTDKYIQRTIPEIPDAYRVFEDMYSKAPAEADLGKNSSADFQAKFVRTALEDCMEDLRHSVHNDLRNMHTEILRQFQIQQVEVAKQFEAFREQQKEAADEVAELRAENERLKKQLLRH